MTITRVNLRTIIAVTMFAIIASPAAFTPAACGQTKSVEASRSAEAAWAELVGKGVKRPEFAFVENNSDLPNVLIYGDSISIGYTQRVRQKLAGKANVYRLFSNGSDSSAFIPKMKKMHQAMQDKQLDKPWTFDWDVIHFNVGLHDLKYLKGKNLDKQNGKQVTSLEDYEKNLNAIVAYLKQLAPDAKLVYATTTSVPEKAPGRIAGDAKKYNEVAEKVMKKFPEIVVNDMYSFTKPKQQRWMVKPGDVHYKTLGKNAQGDEVAKVILKSLSK